MSDGDWEVLGSEFHILTVCMGNVCRSPIAAAILQSGFDELAPGRFQVRSAGTHALVGAPVTREISGLAARLGVDVAGAQGRQVTVADLQQADLILAMDRANRSEVVELVPQGLRKTFTLRELARILPQVRAEHAATPDERWRSAVVLAGRQRRPLGQDPGADDVTDPFLASEATYREMAGQLVPATDALIQWERRAGGS